MTSLNLSEGVPLILRAGAWLGGGTLIGAFHFLTLRWNVAMLARGRAPLRALALALGRFAFVAGSLAVVAAYFGALPLLLTGAGIVGIRAAVVRKGGVS